MAYVENPYPTSTPLAEEFSLYFRDFPQFPEDYSIMNDMQPDWTSWWAEDPNAVHLGPEDLIGEVEWAEFMRDDPKQEDDKQGDDKQEDNRHEDDYSHVEQDNDLNTNGDFFSAAFTLSSLVHNEQDNMRDDKQANSKDGDEQQGDKQGDEKDGDHGREQGGDDHDEHQGDKKDGDEHQIEEQGDNEQDSERERCNESCEEQCQEQRDQQRVEQERLTPELELIVIEDDDETQALPKRAPTRKKQKSTGGRHLHRDSNGEGNDGEPRCTSKRRRRQGPTLDYEVTGLRDVRVPMVSVDFQGGSATFLWDEGSACWRSLEEVDVPGQGSDYLEWSRDKMLALFQAPSIPMDL